MIKHSAVHGTWIVPYNVYSPNINQVIQKNKVTLKYKIINCRAKKVDTWKRDLTKQLPSLQNVTRLKQVAETVQT